jgi:hypothetical protein
MSGRGFWFGLHGAMVRSRTGDPTLVVATDLDTRFLGPLEGEGLDVRVHDAGPAHEPLARSVAPAHP